jgi:putative transposase
VKSPLGRKDRSSHTDRGKLLGTKRHVLTDQKGIPLSITITGANTHDMKSAIDTLDTMIVQRPICKQNLCLDKGYDFSEIEIETIKRKYIPHIPHRGEEKGLIKTSIQQEDGW